MKFIHFGCWNNLNKVANDGLKNVSVALNNTIGNNSNNEYDFLSICGDNYYPNKQKDKTTGVKTKSINTKLLTDGFDLLPTSIKIIMTLGNHDLETIDDNNKCQILKDEMEKVKTLNNIEYVFCKCFINNNSLFIMIDSSLYLDDAGEVNEYIPCYNEFLGTGATGAANADALKNQQYNIISSYLENNKTEIESIKNVFVFGHHPIVQLKNKKNKDNVNSSLVNIMDELFVDNIIDPINKIVNNISYYYLCADLHYYQYGNLTYKDKYTITQYIVGTGGAELDDPMTTHNGSFTYDNGNIKYNIIGNERTHGFLKCLIENNNVQFDFVPVEGGTGQATAATTIGGKRKRKRRRTKKIKRKRLMKKTKRRRR